MVFERTLSDLVRGIRTHKNDEANFINKCLAEIKEELKSPDVSKKIVAVQKLTYLQMLGYDMSWAAFNVVEVMSCTKFSGKRVGYLAASQSFHEGTDVIIICTNLIRKDMTSPNTWEAGLAINCLANICTPDLARDLAADVVALLSSSRPYVRKKACLVLFKIFLKFPDALRPAFPRLKDKLEDHDPSVVSAAVTVICELAKKNPKNYIAIAPILYKILTTCNNNWQLIKLIKLFGSLLQVEKRLAKKLIQPLHNIMNSTPAVSLMYECIQTCTIGLTHDIPTMKLCVNKLRNFVEDPDQNLKYLGLVALNNIMKVHPKAVAEHKDLIITCLDDEDITIRLRALDLLEGMVTKRNIADIVRRLLEKAENAEGEFKDGIVEKIIAICSKNSYQYISDFEWYLSVLMQIAHTPGISDTRSISNQFMDVIIRVKVVRPFGVKNMVELIQDTTLLPENPKEYAICEMLYAAGWLTGEFANEASLDYLQVIKSLLNPKVVVLPPHIQSVYVHSALKLFSIIALQGDSNELLESENGVKESPLLDQVIEEMRHSLQTFTHSNHSEVQERACFTLEVLNLFEEYRANGMQFGQQISSLFADPLNPVAPKAQKKVPIPEGLDLDSWINEPEEEEEYDFDKGFDFLSKEYEDTSEEELAVAQQAESQREARQQRRVHDPFYLSTDVSATKQESSEEDIPTVKLSEKDLGGMRVEPSIPEYKLHLKKKPSKPKKSTERPVVLQNEILPEGATVSSDDSESEEDNPFKTIDFKQPLKPEEQLPTRTHRVVQSKPQEEKKKSQKEKTKKKKHQKEESKHGKHRSKKEKSTLIDLDGEEQKKKPKRKEKKEKREKKEKKEKKAKPSPHENVSPQLKQIPKYKPLCQDENVSVIYEIRVNPNESRRILVNFAFKNLSANAITNLKFDIPATLNIKPSAQSSMNPNVVLEGGQTNQHNILFEVSAINQPMKVTGSITYKINGNGFSKDFKLAFPCSSFIYPVKLQKEEFVSILRKGHLTLSSCTVRTEKDFRSFVATLANSLRVDLVLFDNKTASYYGKSIQGHEVAIYSKALPDCYSIDLKCSDSTLGNSLLQESQQLF